MDFTPPAPEPVAKRRLPSGTVAFLFTDIEGSTVRWDRNPDGMQLAVQQHDRAVRAVIEQRNGYVFKALGDAFCAAFSNVDEAVEAALAAQRELAAHDFSSVDGILVRIAIHVGTADERDADYFGPALNRVARLLSVAHGGQVLLSSAAADAVGDRLPEAIALRDLGEHRLKDLSELEHVFQVLAPDLPSDFPKLRSLTVETNLPQRLSGLVGRDADVENLKSLLNESRLVTLCGAGGLGKTRCAIEVGADVFDDYRDGVWFADLAPLSDPSLVASTIAAIFEVREAPGRPVIDVLVAHLRKKKLLLILDNCEHLIAEASDCASAVLRLCPAVRMLATSREALNVAGESVYRMPSLSVPKRPAGLTAEAARDYGAPLLFEARARSANPRFALDDGNAAVVAEICIRLDGIPLAIELAAARMKVLTPVQLAQKLDERFRVLTGGSRTALPRQQTMMALIDWSYDLLSDDERWLFRHLSIFAGGFMMDAATVVGANESIGEFEILDLLASLVDKSLVVSEPFGDEHRYRLLESMRQYARQKLVEANERPRAAALHADVYTELAERLEREYEDVPYGEWLTRAEAELENVRAALSWAFSGDGDPLLGQRLAATLYRVFGVFAAAEARRWIETAQSRVSDATPGVLAAKLKLGEAFLASAFNQFRASLAAARQALESFTELDDERGIMEAQRLAGRALVYLGQVDEGAHLLSESFERRQKAGSGHVGGTLRDLAAAHALRGDVAQARALLAQAATAFQEESDEGNVATTAATLAEAEYRCGDAEAALRHAEEALEAVRALGRQRTEALILGNIAAYLIALDRYEPARVRGRSALQVAGEVQSGASLAFALGHLGAVGALRPQAEAALALEERKRASRILGFVDERLARLEIAREYTEQREYDRAIAALRSELDAAALEAALSQGRAWTEERAVAEALLI